MVAEKKKNLVTIAFLEEIWNSSPFESLQSELILQFWDQSEMKTEEFSEFQSYSKKQKENNEK